MRNNPILLRRIVQALLFLSMLITNSVSAAFIISGECNCHGSYTYSYHFSETAFLPDFTVKVSETAFSPDITMKLVSDPKQTDLIFVDGFNKVDVKVCKGSSFLEVKTVKVSESAFSPDITIKYSETPFSPDYKIFILSEIFTKEEAAAHCLTFEVKHKQYIDLQTSDEHI